MTSVEEQYSRWIYPQPIKDLEAAIAQGARESADPHYESTLIWPAGAPSESLDILVAGCGSSQAAYFALSNPTARIVGIDISGPSLEHQAKLRDKHGLTNLDLIKLDLCEVGSLGRSFDYIVSTGVLHHLPAPDAGLHALKKVLRPEGSLLLMLYNAHGRYGVYMLQEAFRILGLGQTQADIETVKSTLSSLPREHQAKLMATHSPDLQYDAGIVDTFLHSQDQAYSVKQCYEFVERSGLRFQAWVDPLDFAVQAYLPPTHPLYAKIRALPPRDRAHTIDLLHQFRSVNRFLACHPKRANTDISFAGDSFLAYIPQLHYQAKTTIVKNTAGEDVLRIERRQRAMDLSRTASLILSQINGTNTCRTIIEILAGPGDGFAPATDISRTIFSDLFDLGHLVFRTR